MPSDVWKHFNKSGSKAVCECEDEVSLGKSGTTTTCANHLKSVKHIEAMKNINPSAPKKAKTESVATLFSPGYSKQRSKDLVSDVTDFIVDSNLPFSIAESPFLRRLINSNYGLAKAPSRHDISAVIPSKARQCNESLQLFVKDQLISLTPDEFSHKEQPSR